jgi:hypothetical protein
MTSLDIVHRRLFNQRLVGTAYEKPDEVVRWLGAVQAQEYAGAKWALALRMKGISDAALDQAFADGTILRTHVLRPTWHFVTPADIRWLLELTAPRVNAVNALYYRRLELDDALFAQSNAVLAKALQGGKQLTRSELASMLQRAGIITATGDRLRLTYLVMRAELDRVICSGALRGKQHTYALLDERAPQAEIFERDEALATLTRRYFTSHGPATLRDYTSWSGLSTSDARLGIEMVKSELVEEAIDGKAYWLSANTPTRKKASPIAHLLPAYDEYTVAYKDRSAILDPQYVERATYGIGNVIVLDGQIVGTWKRTFEKDTVVVTLDAFTSLTEAENQAVAAAAQQYGAFLDMPVVLA